MTLSGNTAIADTGTTLALVSDEVCDALYKAIPGAKYDSQQQGYVFPLTTKPEDLPEFKVAVGDNLFVIQPEDLAFAPADDKNWYGGVQSRGNNPFDILGDAFLKSVYAVCLSSFHSSFDEHIANTRNRSGTKETSASVPSPRLKKRRT